jgi:opacity protein-like surface antigen
MKRTSCIVLPLAALLIMAAASFAQTQYRCDLYGAANFPLNKDFTITAPQSTTPLQGTHKFSTGFRGGIRLGADGRGHWGQDLDYSYGSIPSKIVIAPNGEFSITNRTHQFSYNVLWYPGGAQGAKKKYFPYLTAGVGAVIFQVSQDAKNDAVQAGLGTLLDHTTFAFNAGGGVRVRINSVWGFRVDVRDVMSHPVRYGIPASSSDPATFVFPVTGVFHQFQLSMAFNYYFKS